MTNQTNGQQMGNVILEGQSWIGMVSDEVRLIVVVINYVVLIEIVGLFGIAVNIVNIVVFYRQGYRDTVNISLTALSVADLGSLLTLQWFIICVNPWLTNLNLSFQPLEIQSLTAGFPHIYFTRVAGWITAFISLERCLCISLPLKVKRIITKEVTLVYNISIFFILSFVLFPQYLTTYYDRKFYPSLNKTLIGIIYRPNKNQVQSVSFFITDCVVPFLSVFIVIVCCIIIRAKLNSKAAWRQTATTASLTTGEVSRKEKRVIVMILSVSVIFILCLVPFSVIMCARALEPGLSITGKYSNLNWVIVSVGFMSDTINSTINFFVYYKMSAKFKATLQSTFMWCFGKETSKESKPSIIL